MGGEASRPMICRQDKKQNQHVVSGPEDTVRMITQVCRGKSFVPNGSS